MQSSWQDIVAFFGGEVPAARDHGRFRWSTGRAWARTFRLKELVSRKVRLFTRACRFRRQFNSTPSCWSFLPLDPVAVPLEWIMRQCDAATSVLSVKMYPVD